MPRRAGLTIWDKWPMESSGARWWTDMNDAEINAKYDELRELNRTGRMVC